MAESAERDEIVEMLSGMDVRLFPITNAALASSVLLEQPIDCLVIGPGAPVLDLHACEPLLIDAATGLGQPAFIFYATDRSETSYGEFRQRFKDRLTLREAPSRQRLLEQTVQDLLAALRAWLKD
ncbi:MAG: hypothetical protein ACREU6_10565 [Steroidobacteraceae bacterium]